jgi:hypothetical protein
MDALAKIKRNYYLTTPQKRRALETILGVETFQNSDSGLSAVAFSGAKLIESRDKALQGQ